MLHRLLGRLVARPKPPGPAERLYDKVAAQARRPIFFEGYGFADTVLGRLDVLHLHLFLLTRRLAADGTPQARELSQLVFDRHVDALDLALRQLGVGDLSVPKRKKRMVRDFYGLVAAFDAAVSEGAPAGIADCANRRFFGDQDAGAAKQLAAYVASAAATLASQPASALLAGEMSWPTP